MSRMYLRPWRSRWRCGRRRSSAVRTQAGSSTECWAGWSAPVASEQGVAAEQQAVALAGRPVADAVLSRVRNDVARLVTPPRLVFVRVGDDPASISYVRSKERAAQATGIAARTVVLPGSTGQAELQQLLEQLSRDRDVDGILLQLPLPDGLSAAEAIDCIAPDKDVDGLHPVNVGRLWNGEDGLFPCTALGLIELLDHYGIGIEGREAVIVGRSQLVGKPAAALFLRRNATVTLAHSRTEDLAGVVRRADIVVAAVGVPGIIKEQMVRPGAAVLDVGLTRVDGKIRGDVSPDVARVAAALTPMPGGTGLLTVAMLLVNTVTAATRRQTRDR